MQALAQDLDASNVDVRWGVRIALRDGVELSATAYVPSSGHPPAPGIVTLTPYIAQSWHDQALYFAAQGFPFVAVDVRGRGNSEGEFRPLINEAQDAFDVVEWLARQPYCNGQVTMWGGSYGGHVQWAAAGERPPHLATIVPVASPHIGVDFPLRTHSFKTYLMQWLTLVWGRTSQDKLFWNNERFWANKFRQWFESGAPFNELDVQCGMPSLIFQEWIAHPEPDEYWDRYNPTSEQYAKMCLPILTITGSYDGDQPGALMHYRQHLANVARAEHYLVIGPWDHAGTRAPQAEFCGIQCGPASLVDLPKLHLEWYRWAMQSGPKPEFLRNKVAYYVMGAERWRYVETLEAVTARTEPLYLQSNDNPTDLYHTGSLTLEKPQQSEPDHYIYDPRDISLAKLESTVHFEDRTDQRMVHAAAGKHLVYHSAPFQQDVEISGFFKLIAWLSIDQPDTDFRASVYEICLDGRSILLSSDSIRARYRENPHSAKLIDTKDQLRYTFDRFMFISREVKKGHRLRLVIGPVNSIYWQKNYNSGGVVAQESMKDAQAVMVRLFHDAMHPSALYVPIGQPS